MRNFQLDLHTHSIISYDGGITEEQYRRFLNEFPTMIVAVTDHNEVSFAQNLRVEFRDRVIVGEEIMTLDGEIIGLFLKTRIEPGLSALDTIKQIQSQSGLIYIPHPFEIRRHGLKLEVLEKLSKWIDIIEIFNARAIEPWAAQQAEQFAAKHHIATAGSSDAHSLGGLGTTYNLIDKIPVSRDLVALLETGEMRKQHAPLWSLLAPARNKLKKKLNI